MDSKQQFFSVIHSFYAEAVDGKLPADLLNDLCAGITEYYYEQYTRFAKQYPKSIKRYSTFHTKDLDHPSTFDIVIRFFKKKTGSNYFVYAKMVLKMTSDELIQYEKRREEFHKMW